jgi:lactate racemase
MRNYMNKTYALPYGKNQLQFTLNEKYSADLYLPAELRATEDEILLIYSAIRNPLFTSGFSSSVGPKTTVAITINDKTRPVPNNKLFPPLLETLQKIGIKKENIHILIAVGTHTPMPQVDFHLLLNDEKLSQYHLVSHNCDDESNLTYKGITSRGTEVYVNSLFDRANIKIVVGNIEPHHFAGFSGGAKSASIGMCARKSITHNHSFLQDPHSCVGRYEDNPLRQDIEEMGQLIGVDLALNAILNEKNEILHVFFGKPKDVLEAGIKVIRETELALIDEQYDLVIASAGGYPKDINLYQGQKALTHASLFCKPGGTVFLVTACEEGVGSQVYIDFMDNVHSYAEARKKFAEKGFKVGPHKVIQFAAIADRINFQIKTEIDQALMRKLLLEPITDLESAIKKYLKSCTHPPRIAILPYATATIPQFRGKSNEQ